METTLEPRLSSYTEHVWVVDLGAWEGGVQGKEVGKNILNKREGGRKRANS